MPTGEPQRLPTQGKIGVSVDTSVGQELKKQGVELKGVKASIVVTLKDKNNNVVMQKEYPANSFLLNFMRILYAVLTVSSYNAKNMNGDSITTMLCKTKKTVRYTVEYREIEYERILAGYQAWALKEDDTHGILIGIGTKIVDAEDYALESKVPNGIGSGKMLYMSSEVGNVKVVGNDARLELKRSFINHSGADITVTEVGLAIKQFCPEDNILVIRDTIEPITVPNNYTLDVQYTIIISV